jgi:hypothetical protein
MKIIDKILNSGQINWLTYLKNSSVQNKKIFLCHCGKETTQCPYNVYYGKVKSCGCMKSKLVSSLKNMGRNVHRDSGVYTTYHSMKARCYNPKLPAYKYYGGRGILVCDRWLKSFDLFLEDMGERPSINHSIDRIDVNGNYDFENCRWADNQTQAENKRNNIRVIYNGNLLTISKLSIITGVKYGTLYSRYLKGLRGESLFTANTHKKGQKLRLLPFNDN